MIPYKSRNRIEVDADVAENLWQPVGAPLRGELRSIFINQISGALEGFSITIHDRPPLDEESLSELGPDEFSEESSVLVGPMAVAAGQRQFRQVLNPGQPFVAWRDDSGTSRESFLYVRISPLGTGLKVFEVAYDSVQPELA